MRVSSQHLALCQGLFMWTVRFGVLGGTKDADTQRILLGNWSILLQSESFPCFVNSNLHVWYSLLPANNILRKIKTCGGMTNIWTDGFCKHVCKVREVPGITSVNMLSSFIFFFFFEVGDEQISALCENLNNILSNVDIYF